MYGGVSHIHTHNFNYNIFILIKYLCFVLEQFMKSGPIRKRLYRFLKVSQNKEAIGYV